MIEERIFMYQIKRKDGFILILEEGETCPGGEICFIGDEWSFTKGLAAGYAHDPEALESFWTSLFEKKKNIPGYLIFCDFPREMVTNQIEENKAPYDVSAGRAYNNPDGAKRARDILDMLKAKGYSGSHGKQIPSKKN